MKKIRDLPKYRKLQRRRNTREIERRQSHDLRLDRWLSNFNEWKFRSGLATKSPERIAAPSDFSLIRNPDQSIKHITEVENRADAGRIIVSDLALVDDFSTDAIVGLLAYANDPKTSRGGQILIRQPERAALAEKYVDSGIYGGLNIRFADGNIRPAHGTIFRTTDTEVKGEIARSLIEFSTRKIFGEPQKLKGVYTTMIECMNNTFNHANLNETSKEIWWATVYCDTERRVAFYNFLDNGVGILESIKLRYSDAVLRMVGFRSNEKLLKDVLEGKIGSRTGLSYRGNGLPEIYKRFHRGQISRLIIIANDVFADVEKDEYRLLSTAFKGTFFHWEVSYDKHFATDDDND